MTAVQGAVGHMLRVLLDNLETKARTYKNKVDPLLHLAVSWLADDGSKGVLLPLSRMR